MLRLVFPNGAFHASDHDAESLLNRTREESVRYWVLFDETGTPEKIGHSGISYQIDWLRQTCTCPFFQFHRTCKHLDALAALLPRLVRVRCGQCYGDGYDEALEPCERCLGEGYTWTILPPQRASAGSMR